MQALNLNCIVKVKLTDYGKNIFYHKYDEVNDTIAQRGWKPIEPRFPKVDDEGFSKFQLWDFINIYGEYFQLGSDRMPIKDLCIYIDENDLDEV